MAFGIERVLEAVKGVNDALHNGFKEIRGLIDGAKRDIGLDVDSVRSSLERQIGDTQRIVEEAKTEAVAARRDIAGLRAEIMAWKAEAAAAKAAAEEVARQQAARREAETEEVSAGGAEPVKARIEDADDTKKKTEHNRHLRLLLVAAGISSATLTCHRDLWAFLVEKAADEQHFRVPSEVREGDGNVRVVLSGRSIIAALTALWEVRNYSLGNREARGDWALANELYESIAVVVESLMRASRNGDGDGVAITIDHRPAPEPDAEPGAEQADEGGDQGDGDQPPRPDDTTD